METSAEMTLESLLDSVKFDDKGLVPAIVQDVHSGEVLMFAWMNRESLEYTVRERKACYWSRSRKELWVKGLTSGNTQEVHDVRLDCDADAILIKVTQVGGACHTGFRSCFYRTADGGRWREDGELAFDAAKVYKKSAS